MSIQNKPIQSQIKSCIYLIKQAVAHIQQGLSTTIIKQSRHVLFKYVLKKVYVPTYPCIRITDYCADTSNNYVLNVLNYVLSLSFQ